MRANLASAAIAARSYALAHPVSDPFDHTIFAPADRLRIEISFEGVPEGLTAPLTGRAGPGHPGRLYLVGPPGTLRANDTTN